MEAATLRRCEVKEIGKRIALIDQRLDKELCRKYMDIFFKNSQRQKRAV